MALSGNKGEWSEIYVLLKLLAEGKLYAGDPQYRKIENILFPILRVLRKEKENLLTLLREEATVRILTPSGEELSNIPLTRFGEEAQSLFNEIKNIQSSCQLPQREKFLKEIGINQLKAPSSQKTDITLVVYDKRIGTTPTLGFSIKSQIGSSATLLNASQSTNIKYRLSRSLSEEEISIANSLKPKQLLSYLRTKNISLSLDNYENSIFENNLRLIDTALPQIIATIVLQFYTEGMSKIAELCQWITQQNPLSFQGKDHPYYSYKLKRFLVDAALGMTPAKVWKGEYDTTGGYIIVKQDGELLCYHLYERQLFENYLFYNIKLDTPSTQRHHFGKIIEEKRLCLNIQLRFI